MLSTILTALLTFAADWLQSWYRAQAQQHDEWAAAAKEGQMASLKRSQAAEAQIAAYVDEAGHLPPPPPGQWNMVMRAALLAVALAGLPGCFLDRQVYVPSRLPVIPVPTRPVLPAGVGDWTPREQILVGYALRLEACIKAYNSQAAHDNAANGY